MRVGMWYAATGLIIAALFASGAVAQEPPKYDELQNMYKQALKSLKDQQDSKAKLAQEKEDLAKQVTELQKQLDTVTKDRDELVRQTTAYAERTYNLRASYAAWQEFLKRYPSLHAKWKMFLDAELLKMGNDAPALIEPEWPFRLEG
jgi:septal ring factor EnvC (AmiA/AmiB activator)